MRHLLWLPLLLISFISLAQIPDGYYDDAEGKTGEDLRTALYNIIKDHSAESYSDLWEDFKSTDKKDNGKVWDIYSIKKDGSSDYEYTFSDDQCGDYSAEGDCYNREHSFPKSWFNDDSPMYTDLFHIYPTDGYVNGKRANLPYGETDNASWTSTNGSKIGYCSYVGYTDKIFEPIDEFKGDLARSYFYMLTRYKDVCSSWTSDMLEGDHFAEWARKMLVEWAEEDTVSQKEIDRNNAIYDIQNNRNPYIDHPEWVKTIWGDNTDIQTIKKENIKTWYAKHTLFVTNRKNETYFNIVNITGQVVATKELSNNSNSYEINLHTGVYFISFYSKNKITTKKILIP